MSNHFCIPKEIEDRIRDRDITCVYCHKPMKEYAHGPRKDMAQIEHLNFDGPFYWTDSCKKGYVGGLKEEDLAICCGSCNPSRGVIKLAVWFEGDYCKKRNINKESVAECVKKYIQKNLKKNGFTNG